MQRCSIYKFFSVLLLCIVSKVSAQTNISGVINSYVAVTSITSQAVTVASSAGFVVGDRVLLIQMKGASITQSNTPAYGSISNINDCGNYELGTIASISSNTITFSSPLLKSYTVAGLVQLVKVPVYTNATVTASLTCLPWNGTTGGILAFECTGTLNLLADIDASGKGFRGGGFSAGTVTGCAGDTSNYVEPTSYTGSGLKGEGVFITTALNEKGRGSNGNGGGPGSNINGGGAGGANFSDGGYGGNIMSSASCPSSILLNCGGIYGRALPYSNTLNKIFLGGGAGSGHMNDNAGTAGTNGGGIILIRANVITANNHSIMSNGLDNSIIAGIDGQGGGGAGGTILLDVCNQTNLNILAKGGYGGVDNYGGPDCHGKGGGGSGGVVWSGNSLTGATINVNGGQPGIFTNSNSWGFNTPLGATAGQVGGTLSGLAIPGAVPFSSGTFSLTINHTDNICNYNTTASAQANTSGAGPYTYLWSPGNYTTAAISNLSAGLYTVTVSAGVCATQTQTVLITSPSVPVIDVITNASNCMENNGSFVIHNITDIIPPYAFNFNNSGYTSDTVFSSVSSGSYTLSVKDSNYCVTNYILTMPESSGDYTLYIPNTFTPNNDKTNDIWYIQGSCLGALHCWIYNRWGEKIKELKDIKEGWDGSYGGKQVPDGVYVYVIEVETQSGKINKAGHIAVFR